MMAVIIRNNNRRCIYYEDGISERKVGKITKKKLTSWYTRLTLIDVSSIFKIKQTKR